MVYELSSGLLLNLAAFALIGMGPSLLLLAEDGRFRVAVAIAPVIGFALTSVFGSYFVLLDYPVSRWCGPWLLLATLISVILAVVRLRKDASRSDRESKRLLLAGLAGFLATAALTVAPPAAGGQRFMVLRGNGSDSFNYVTVAGYLDHEPYSWAQQVDRQTLVNRHQSYERARQLLNARWATSMMLAFSSRVAQVPLVRFEYCFSVLCFLLAFGPAFLFAIYLGLHRVEAALLALVVCAGFWAQFVLDVRAQSHISAIPILLVLALLVARIERAEASGVAWGEHALIGLASTTLVLLYTEIVPMAMLGFGVYFGAAAWRRRFTLGRVRGYLLSLLLAVVGLLPAAGFLARFMRHQLSYAATGTNTWHNAYFGWLYGSPLTGLWGLPFLGPASRSGAVPFAGILQAGLVLLGAMLTVGTILALMRLWPDWATARTSALALAHCLAAAALLQFAYLYWRGQWWAAGKGLSLGYPFLLFSLGGIVLAARAPADSAWRAHLAAWFRLCLALWIAGQCLLGLYRTRLAVAAIDYPNYIWHHGEYRRHDWDLSRFTEAIRGQQGITVWSHVSNPWLSDYLGFALGWEVNLVSLLPTHDSVEFGAPRPTPSQPPQYLLVETATLGNAPAASRSFWGMTRDLSIFRADSDNPVLLGLRNPNGIEGTPQAPFFWMGGSPTVFTLFSPHEGVAILRARFTLGPSLPGRASRSVILRSRQDTTPRRFIVGEGTSELQVAVSSGLNEVVGEIAERAEFFLPHDKRPLLLRLDELEIRAAPRTAAPRR